MSFKIPFNESNYQATTLEYIKDSLQSGHTSGDGKYTKLCSKYIEDKTKTKSALITHSCTAALEMCAMLLDSDPGGEVIMPSYTFVSTANAFVTNALTPVFVDIRKDNYNIDESLIEKAINKNTKAIVVVHYAGVPCEMDTIMEIANKHNLIVIEDAAQGFNSYYKNKHLGSIGHLGAFSFHETKNVISGEGGALLINDSRFLKRAKIIREKGTNRDEFFKGLVDKYSWVDIGSSYLPSDLISAYLYSNLEIEEEITQKRLHIWNKYYDALHKFEATDKIKLSSQKANGHMFYIEFAQEDVRDSFIKHMKRQGILTPFHYLPLHSSPAGKKYGKTSGELSVTNYISSRIARLPIFYNMDDEKISEVINHTLLFLEKNA